MPTPLMPDEEFDAQFRQGLEHYPEQPEDPAAWHRMELLLDADLRQQALRRRVWRLLGAEALLLMLGVWAAFSFLLAKLPLHAGQPPLATASRAATSALPAPKLTRAATATTGRAQEERVLLSSATRPNKQPVLATAEAYRPGSRSRATDTELLTGSGSARLARTASSSAGVALVPPSATHARKAGNKVLENQATARNSTSLAAIAPHSRRSRSAVLTDRNSTSGQGLTATRGPVEAGHELAAAQSKRRLHQSMGARAQRLAAVANYKKALPTTVAAATNKRLGEAAKILKANNQQDATPLASAIPASASTQPIDLLAPRWPANDLRFHRPDSLALLAPLPASRPADSLNRPKPLPLLSAYRFRLGLVGAPEFSTVRADRLTKPGSSLGVQLEYQLGRRWRVSAGYLYTNKLYAARGTDYTLPAGYTLPHGYIISNVDAACRIVDIPLNLRYDLWQRPRYQVFASIGLSSLLMRREQYTYDYELLYGKPVAPYSWELANGSQHVLKVLNLSAGYERAVGQRWTVQAEPFLKLPLAGVGFGAVRLSSAGVFFSLKYGLLPLHPAPAPR